MTLTALDQPQHGARVGRSKPLLRLEQLLERGEPAAHVVDVDPLELVDDVAHVRDQLVELCVLHPSMMHAPPWTFTDTFRSSLRQARRIRGGSFELWAERG